MGTKKRKVDYLTCMIETIAGMGYDADPETEAEDYANLVEDYSTLRSMLLDYAPELESKYPDSFSLAVCFWVASVNEEVKNG
jgi:hypothetical protein